MVLAHASCHECARVHAHNTRMQAIRYVFVGHNPLRMDILQSTWFHAQFPQMLAHRGASTTFSEGFTVFDFLKDQQSVLKFDNQIHQDHWNLVHLSQFVHVVDHIPMFKIFDHTLIMNEIEPLMLQQLQIHAVDVEDSRMHYLADLVTPQNMSYLRTTILPTAPHRIAAPDNHFDPHGPSNEAHHALQEGGHGLFQNEGPVYDMHHNYVGIQFSQDARENPFTCFGHPPPPRPSSALARVVLWIQGRVA